MGDSYSEKSKVFSGAGCMIFEDKYKLTNTTDINDNTILILLKDYTKTYSEPGGEYEEKHKTIEKTALTELREETKNMIVLNKISFFFFFDSKHKGKIYRCFLIQINNLDLNIFKQNKKIIENYRKVPNYWKETKSIKKFYMKNIKENIYLKNLKYCQDINGKYYRLRRRARELIKSIFQQKLNIKKINTKLILNQNEKKKFLNNTKSYIQSPN